MIELSKNIARTLQNLIGPKENKSTKSFSDPLQTSWLEAREKSRVQLDKMKKGKKDLGQSDEI
jgi:hypothetical protein